MFGTAQAQTLESALMPGAVIAGHAKTEHECGKCHARGERAAQPALCLDCHKPVAADVKSGQGYHGRLKDKTCRSCHTEHKGREAKIVKLDTKTFDHNQTDFALKGKHLGRECASCHKKGETWSKAPSECVACHRKDDKHKNGLGEKCANCHNDGNWKDARFDHAKTKFPLRLTHTEAKCADCHQNQHYANTARDCISCHRKDDTHKGHFGAACEKCHGEDKWKQPTFRHDRDTTFALADRHRSTKCESCHRTPLYREKTPTRCIACHRGDDAHKGKLGDKCDKCHSAKGWKDTRFDHDADTTFPLKEKHAKATCQSCHKDDRPNSGKAEKTRRQTPDKCYACHEKDDREKGHKGKFGEECESCHSERGFKFSRFDHDIETKFKLTNKHRSAKCEACHQAPLYAGKTETRCFACHDKDDKDKGHKGRFGEKCESCHNDKSFKEGRFDHDRETEFKLANKHLRAKCESCHKTTLYSTKTDKRCLACHDKEDVHFATYGTDCERCHVADDWRKIIRQGKDGRELKEKKP